jgi:hypothetical protein
MSKQTDFLDIDSPSVINHLTNLQSVINRMAGNSASCKTWSITLVTAIIIFAADKAKPQVIVLGMLPIIAFYLIDVYYLYLENHFRDLYNSFVALLNEGKADKKEIYIIKLSDDSTKIKIFIERSFTSFSTMFFYLMLIILLIVTYFVII